MTKFATPSPAAPIQSPPEAPAADAGQAGSEPASGAVQLLSKEAIADIIREHLGDTYVCGRVWAAWNVGTMSKNDFTPAAECELADDAADAIRAALASTAGATDMPHVAFVEGDEVVRDLRWNANIAAFDYPVGTKLYATPTPVLAALPAGVQGQTPGEAQ